MSSVGIQSSSLRGDISQFLTPTKISEIAIRIGLDSRASFTPNEYQSLLDKAVTVAFEKLRIGGSSQMQDDVSRKSVIFVVDELLSKVCKKNLETYDIVPQFFQNFCASFLWNITAPFYKD